MIQTIDDLIFEAHDASGRFWFVQGFNTVEQTNATVTLHLTIGPSLMEHGIAIRSVSLSSMSRHLKGCLRNR